MSEFDVEVIDLKTNVPLQNVKNAEISYEYCLRARRLYAQI